MAKRVIVLWSLGWATWAGPTSVPTGLGIRLFPQLAGSCSSEPGLLRRSHGWGPALLSEPALVVEGSLMVGCLQEEGGVQLPADPPGHPEPSLVPTLPALLSAVFRGPGVCPGWLSQAGPFCRSQLGNTPRAQTSLPECRRNLHVLEQLGSGLRSCQGHGHLLTPSVAAFLGA